MAHPRILLVLLISAQESGYFEQSLFAINMVQLKLSLLLTPSIGAVPRYLTPGARASSTKWAVGGGI